MNFWESDDMARRIYARYGGKSEEELMRELEQSADKMKREGKFDPVALENAYDMLSPYLNEEQRARMRSIIDMLIR